MRRVLIIAAQLKHYRSPLLVEVAHRLRAMGIELKVAYSGPSTHERAKSDTVDLPDEIGVKVPIWWLFGERVSIQHAWRFAREADLVVIEQGNRHLLNYLLLGLSSLGLGHVAYWGHGYNRQAQRAGFSEWLKRKLLKSADWWFAYTSGVAAYLERQGVAGETISVLHNTIDTSELSSALAGLDEAEKMEVRKQLGIAPSARIGLFCGSLYADKKLDFLIEAALLVRLAIPHFELVVLGDGPERGRIEAATRLYPFVHYVGPVFRAARAPYFAISELFVMPGLVGLAVVDAFAAGLPVVTTSVPIHSPEIEYVHDGANGVITEPDTLAYAHAIAALLVDAPRRRAMRDAALHTAAELPLRRMVDAFVDGIVKALEPRARS